MKNIFRILGITLLTAFYCATIIVAIGISQNSGFSDKSIYVKEKNATTVSIKLLCTNPQSESLAEPSSIIPPITLKNSFNKFFVKAKITENFFANVFTQYISISRNFLIKYLKANIIFPFHYFW